jgi:hypothetical protein
MALVASSTDPTTCNRSSGSRDALEQLRMSLVLLILVQQVMVKDVLEKAIQKTFPAWV